VTRGDPPRKSFDQPRRTGPRKEASAGFLRRDDDLVTKDPPEETLASIHRKHAQFRRAQEAGVPRRRWTLTPPRQAHRRAGKTTRLIPEVTAREPRNPPRSRVRRGWVVSRSRSPAITTDPLMELNACPRWNRLDVVSCTVDRAEVRAARVRVDDLRTVEATPEAAARADCGLRPWADDEPRQDLRPADASPLGYGRT
jgi:hypothetical protein